MAIDPAVLSVWQIVLGIVVACVAFIITFWFMLRLQRTHAFYRFGEAMSIGYAKVMTQQIKSGALKGMPQDPSELSLLTQDIEDQQTTDLAERTKKLQEQRDKLDQQTPPQG